ncbi:MAG TPA: ribulose-bisphosphate carboxylase large subunit family protein [Azospirillaceae bacterium]|nr:ribulose-bisphosphate carboxylase large subunit family protein [Azospirillaceae bacterium]
MNDRFSATYAIETSGDPVAAATEMAGESSTATFVRIPGERADIAGRHGARIERLAETETASRDGRVVRRADVTLSWPLENTGPSLPNILATVAGNLFDVASVTSLRLLDVALPSALRQAYAGPQFGIDGTRELLGATGRPLIGTIVKPSVGLTPEETADLVARLAEGGIDFIKDDELMADPPHCPFERRAEAVMAVLRRHEERTGRRVMYAFNITGEIDQMLRRHDQVAALGGSCVMVSLNWVGVTGLAHLRRHASLPIHGHRNGWGILNRGPSVGVDFLAWHKFFRIAGADHLHVNGIDNKFYETNESVIRSARACLEPVFADGGAPMRVMPVFSSKQTVLQASKTYQALGSVDLIYACGGGIIAHPDGIRAGVESIRQAWEAAMRGVPLDEFSNTLPELRRAISAFA